MNIYRYREATQETLDELSTPYLWFSTRKGFKDVNDANIHALFAKNPKYSKALRKLFGQHYFEYYKTELDKTGICCFARSLSKKKKDLSHFPGEKCIAIEYNKDKLLDYLANNYYIQINRFAKIVRYRDKPTLLEWQGNHIVIERNNNGTYSEPIEMALKLPKVHDTLIANAFSKLHTKFRKQNEYRIIMGCNRIEINIELEKIIQIGNGYKVNVSNDTIEKVYVYPNTPNWFIDDLNKISTLEGKIKSYH